MAITLVASGAVSGTANNGTDVTLTLPTLATGDRVVVVGGHGRRTGSSYGPSTAGYTQHHLRADPGTTGHPVAGVWSKVMGGTPDTSVVCLGSGNTSDAAVYFAYCLTGVDATTPIDVAVAEASSVDPPAVTTATAGAWVITLAAASVNDSTVTVPSGYSNFLKGNQTETNPISMATATKEVASAGSEDPASYSDLTATNPYSFTVAFRPAGGAGAVTGTLSASVPVATASVSGTTTVPTFTGTIAASVLLATAAIAGTTTVPNFTGNLSGSVPVVTGSMAGTTTTPTFTGSVSSSVPVVTGSIAGTTTAPTFTGDVAAVVPLLTGSLSGTTTAPAGSATLDATLPLTAGSVAGTVTAPTFTAALDSSLPLLTGSTDGTVTTPAGSATLDATLPRLTGQLAGTVTGGVAPRDVTVLSVTEHQRPVTVTEHQRAVAVTEHERLVTVTEQVDVTVTEHQRTVTIEGDSMRLPRAGREFYVLEITTDPAVSGWEATFDGATWHAGEVDGDNTRWLLAGPDAEQGTAVAVIAASVQPSIRVTDNPEIIVRSDDVPAVYLVS